MPSINPAARPVIITSQMAKHKPKTKIDDCPWCQRIGCSECDGVGIIKVLDIPEMQLSESDADILRKMLVWKSMVVTPAQIPQLRRAIMIAQNSDQVRSAWDLVLEVGHKSWHTMDGYLDQLSKILMYAQTHEEDVIWAIG
mgnify:CR=1 FL=1